MPSSSPILQIDILRLPYLCIQNVIKCLDPFQLYHFSKISKRSKLIATAIKKRSSKLTVNVEETNFFTLSFSDKVKDKWIFGPFHIFEKNPYDAFIPYNQYLSLEGPHSKELFFESIEDVMELFNCSFERFDLSTFSINKQDLKPVLNWVEKYEKIERIENINGWARNEEAFKTLLENLSKDIGYLFLDGPLGSLEETEVTVEISKPLRIDSLIYYGRAKWLDLNNLRSSNCVSLHMTVTVPSKLTNEDVNLFLKSWKSGESNQNMKGYGFRFSENLDVKTICRGLGAVARNPKMVKRNNKENFLRFNFIHGGIDIQRNDGKIMTISLLSFLTEDENASAPEKVELIYKKNFRKWKQGLMEDISFDLCDVDKGDNLEHIEDDESRRLFFHVW